MRILGIDYGEARTGLAISDETEFLSNTYATLHERNKEILADRVAVICKENNVRKIVLGLPKNMDGTEGFRAQATRLFKDLLAERLPEVPIDFYDERMTTMIASHFMAEAGTKGKKKRNAIDALSAQIILQDYLDRNRN